VKTLVRLKELQFVMRDVLEDNDVPENERHGEWRMYPPSYVAETEIGDYGYMAIPQGHQEFEQENWGKVSYWIPDFDSHEKGYKADSVLSAIQAMRADYYRRVLSCLELEPPK
jgi:hypothetical protein